MLVVLILSTFWNLVYAVGIGLVIASLMFMKKIGDLTGKNSYVKSLKKEEAWEDEANFPEELVESVYIKHINGPLFFGSTNDFQSLSQEIPATASCIIIRMDKMHYIDQSGLYVLEDMLFELIKKGKKVLFVAVQKQPQLMMERIDIIPDLVSHNRLFPNFDTCLNSVKEFV
jgi:SulP family sulfate permease